MGGPGSGAKPREYPAEIVALAVDMYAAGHTIAEVQGALPAGFKAQRIIERHVPVRRTAAKRDQRGPRNHMWKSAPGYQAAHLRLGDERGSCTDCGEPAQHWSYVGGCAEELADNSLTYCTHQNHYEPRCVACHQTYDGRNRDASGRYAPNEEVMPHARDADLRFAVLRLLDGGLDMGVQSVLGGEVLWHCEVEDAPSRILAHRWPDVPNLGDITAVDWHSVPRVDVLTGGSPCTDVSTAGKRAGMRAGTRSGLWASMCDAIEILRPQLVVWENVRGVLSSEADSAVESCPGCLGDGDDGPVLRALGRVLGDLAECGYDAWWCGLRAADVGAPHARYRVFVFAAPADAEDVGHERGRGTRPGRTGPENGGDAPADASRIGWDQWRPESAGIVRGLDAPERGSPHAPDADSDAVRVESVALAGSSGAPEPGWHGEAPPDSDGDGLTRLGRVHAGERDPDGRGREGPTRDDAEPTAWGPYAPAIGRWAAALGRPAPPPTELGPKGAPRLSSRFVEWLMGLPAGHVTDVPGISRSDQLKALGNGVVPAQAAAATRRWLNHYANA